MIGAVLMAFVLVGAMTSALPTADHSKDMANSGWMLLAMIVSVLAMIFAGFVRPASAAKPFWFRPDDTNQSRLRPRRPRSAARPIRPRSKHGR